MAVEGPMSEAPKRSPSKPYTSTLRDRQVAQTREFILDAVTNLHGDRRADEVTTRDMAHAPRRVQVNLVRKAMAN